MVSVTDLYDAASRAGLLTPVIVGGVTVECSFRAPDERVLDGLGLSHDYSIEYPVIRLTLATGDTVDVGGVLYRVREVVHLRDGSEARATLARQS